MQTLGFPRERFESMQLECGVTGQGRWVASIKYRSPHELPSSRHGVVQDHDMSPHDCQRLGSELRSNGVLVEADMGQLRAGGDTVLPGRQKEHSGRIVADCAHAQTLRMRSLIVSPLRPSVDCRLGVWITR
jgi:hypothetical protein